MALKERYQYIEWVDEQKSDFRLMVPIVRSNGISLDNTCSAIRSYREFLGYESSGISTGFKNSKLGAEVSLRNILRDTNDPVLINRANDYLLYLSTNSFTLRRDTSYGGIFRKLNLKNSNIYTLELHPSYRHSPYVAPPETIIFRASKLKFTKPYTQVNNTTSLKKTFVDKVLNDGKTILDDIQKDIAKDQEKSNDKKPNKLQIKRISILLDIVINNFNKASAKDKELVSITIASLHKMGLPQEYFPLRKIEPLWRNSTQSCQTTRLCTGDGSLRKETSTTTTRKFSKEGLEALYFYFSTIIAHPSKLTDEEIVDNIINILNLPMGSLKMTSDLLRQIMNVSKNSE
ncbi:MAG: hypothetical protein VX335_00090, partial [Pseudomonadota bacterium]|nr:hypothetical protein [Pseudomonadota bacterium]